MKFSMAGKSAAKKRAFRLFRDYRQTVHPNPFTFEELYWFGWTREEQQALMLLNESRPESINNGYRVSISCESLNDKRPYLRRPVVVFEHPDGYNSFDYPDVQFSDTAITDPTLRNKLLRWVVRAKQLKNLQDNFEAMFRKHLHDQWVRDGEPGSLNTPGQLFRVWPELASLIEHKYRDRVANQKLKSSLPGNWTDEYVEELKSLEYRKEIDSILLAIGIMEDDLQRDDNYPTV